MRLPDFLVIGALKAGTTYLDELLRSHHEVCLPATLKELDYFGRNYERGPEWYERWFADCGSRRAGEVSPEYLGHPQAPARIHRLLPDARLVACLRDPVERVYSEYKHYVQRHGYDGEFEKFLGD